MVKLAHQMAERGVERDEVDLKMLASRENSGKGDRQPRRTKETTVPNFSESGEVVSRKVHVSFLLTRNWHFLLRQRALEGRGPRRSPGAWVALQLSGIFPGFSL